MDVHREDLVGRLGAGPDWEILSGFSKTQEEMGKSLKKDEKRQYTNGRGKQQHYGTPNCIFDHSTLDHPFDTDSFHPTLPKTVP